jgi:hypothetical protein
MALPGFRRYVTGVMTFLKRRHGLDAIGLRAKIVTAVRAIERGRVKHLIRLRLNALAAIEGFYCELQEAALAEEKVC